MKQNLEYFVDDGYSGANFQRPDWQRMMAMVDEGKIGIVIAKDMSRIGRNYLEVGMYTEITFPQNNVRFIAVNSGVDSANQSDNEFAPFCVCMMSAQAATIVAELPESQSVSQTATMARTSGQELLDKVKGLQNGIYAGGNNNSVGNWSVNGEGTWVNQDDVGSIIMRSFRSSGVFLCHGSWRAAGGGFRFFHYIFL